MPEVLKKFSHGENMRELVKSLPDPSSSAISGVTKLMTNTYVSFLFTQIAQGIQSSRKLMTDAYASFPFTQIARGIQWSRLTNLLVFSGREARLEMARKLMDTYKPKIIRLKRGSIKRLDKSLIIEKTPGGKIILYETPS
jgi:hypothetical protein